MQQLIDFVELYQQGRAKIEAAVTFNRTTDGELQSISEEVYLCKVGFDPKTGELGADYDPLYLNADQLDQVEESARRVVAACQLARSVGLPKLDQKMAEYHAQEEARLKAIQEEQAAALAARQEAEIEERSSRTQEALAAAEARAAADGMTGD